MRCLRCTSIWTLDWYISLATLSVIGFAEVESMSASRRICLADLNFKNRTIGWMLCWNKNSMGSKTDGPIDQVGWSFTGFKPEEDRPALNISGAPWINLSEYWPTSLSTTQFDNGPMISSGRFTCRRFKRSTRTYDRENALSCNRAFSLKSRKRFVGGCIPFLVPALLLKTFLACANWPHNYWCL